MNINKNHHYVFLFILSLNYLIPLMLFGDVTLFYIDSLDSEIAYNLFLGKHYNGDFEAIDTFLGGSLKIEYLRRIYQPMSLLYAFMNTELAYWSIDVLVKLTSYFSFYILSKKINKNLFICAMAGAIYASLNIHSHEGFSLAIFPYIVYLSFFKKKLSIKHFLIIIICAVNSDIFRGTYIFLILLFLPWVFKIKFNLFFKNYLKILFIFLPAMFLSNINMFEFVFFGEPFHRQEWLYQGKSFDFIIIDFFATLFKFPLNLDYRFAFTIGSTILAIPVIIWAFLSNNDIAKRIVTLLIIIKFFVSLLGFGFISELRNSVEITKIVGFQYINTFDIFLYSILIVILIKEHLRFKQIFSILVFSSLLTLQTDASIGPLYKKFFDDKNKFRNFYTFEGFYYPEAYKKIKQKVENSRILSIGLDPMAANVNNIKTLGGYFPFYPLDYKKKFLKVIEYELEFNQFWKDYYNNWGSRVYAMVNDPENVLINFEEAKKLGAEFVLSGFALNSPKLVLICEECKNDNFYLYKIK